MDFIDLRSDTVTNPTPEMREAMAKAKVGDDVFGDDPTVNQLQEMAAEKVGMEAGLFVPSGTMGNLVAIMTHCGRGDEAIVGAHSHTVLFEGGGLSYLGGVHSRQIQEQVDGSLKLEDIESVLRVDDVHEPPSRLIEIENTHNRCGGVYQSPEYIRALTDFAHERGLVVHMDGARVFNAAAAQKVDVKQLTSSVDSVTFCLSKGLCAPVGSVLCSSKKFVDRARHIRKHLGGGMRQAGILAAAGIVALEKMTTRLNEDHARARHLAEGLSEIQGVELDAGSPSTNMIFFNLADSVKLNVAEIEKRMKVRGVLVEASSPRRFRVVTHYWIDDAGADLAVKAFAEALAN